MKARTPIACGAIVVLTMASTTAYADGGVRGFLLPLIVLYAVPELVALWVSGRRLLGPQTVRRSIVGGLAATLAGAWSWLWLTDTSSAELMPLAFFLPGAAFVMHLMRLIQAVRGRPRS